MKSKQGRLFEAEVDVRRALLNQLKSTGKYASSSAIFVRSLAAVLTEQGRNELTATWRYITSPAYALFSSVRSEEFAKVSHAAETAKIGVMVPDPTLGFYSQAAFNQGVAAQDVLYAGGSDIIQGRKQVSELDGFVKEWQQKAGDKMRAEFQEAIEASKK